MDSRGAVSRLQVSLKVEGTKTPACTLHILYMQREAIFASLCLWRKGCLSQARSFLRVLVKPPPCQPTRPKKNGRQLSRLLIMAGTCARDARQAFHVMYLKQSTRKRTSRIEDSKVQLRAQMSQRKTWFRNGNWSRSCLSSLMTNTKKHTLRACQAQCPPCQEWSNGSRGRP